MSFIVTIYSPLLHTSLLFFILPSVVTIYSILSYIRIRGSFTLSLTSMSLLFFMSSLVHRFLIFADNIFNIPVMS